MRRQKGLTLVELIVVIGLILFVATAFIFPASERVRGKATEVVCISNLRQIGQALLMYAQDHDGLVPPYSNQEEVLSVVEEINEVEEIREIRHIGRHLTSYRGRRWRSVFEPYVRDNNIFFCPKDPFAGLPPSKTPSQGLPGSCRDFFYASALDHSVTSYMTTLQEWWFEKGYCPTIDPYRNMRNYPREWLFAPMAEGLPWVWFLGVNRLHDVAVYLQDYTHFISSEEFDRAIDLFYDGHVERHPCSIERELTEYFKQYEKGGKGHEAKELY